METERGKKRSLRLFTRIVLLILAIVVIALSYAGIYISRNFNQLLSEQIHKGFNKSIISDVYDLKFEKLRVNILTGNIKVLNVTLEPRRKLLHDYPYINSSFQLKTSKLVLEDVKIMTLVKTGKLELKRIEINRPEIQVWLTGRNHVFLPYKDTLAVKSKTDTTGKKFLNSFLLSEFALLNASFHIINTDKQRQFSVQNLNITLNSLNLTQQSGLDLYSVQNVELKIGELSGKMMNGIRSFELKDFEMNISGFDIRKSKDTLVYHYADFNTGLKDLNMNLADSVLNLRLKSLNLSCSKKSISLKGFSIKPNLSQAEMVRREKYQKAQFILAAGSIELINVNFDTLIYYRKLFVDEIKIAKVDVSLFKDKFKPFDRTKFPQYLGQKLAGIPIPIVVNNIKVSGISFTNVEHKEDGKYARVVISHGTLQAKNITNLPSKSSLTLNATGFVENKAPISLTAAFSYLQPQFSFSCRIGKFNLPDLNGLLAAYTPAKIRKGVADEISFTGTVFRTKSTGTMKFLYHELDIDLKLTEKKWQNTLVAFAANTYLNTNNPQPGKPAIVVQFKADRDMNKGGFNIILRSFLAGMKETMVLTKGNKQAYKEAKKAAKAEKRANEGGKGKLNPIKKK